MPELECQRSPDLESFERVSRISTHRNMPVDFTSYLLSASPPGLDFYAVGQSLTFTNGLNTRRNGGFASKSQSKLANYKHNGLTKTSSDPDIVLSQLNNLRLRSSLACHGGGDDDTIPHLSHSHSCDDVTFALDDEKVKSVKYTEPPRDKMGKKKVSFADDLGFSLVSVRIVRESTDTPPKLHHDILSSLRKGTSAEVTDTPPLVLNFSQPASDYLAFREKLAANCVSLENVILRDYKIMGTIKVKNISFEKNVFVRCTFDSWETNLDISAVFVPSSIAGLPNDTFSFEINVPTDMDIRKKIQFCVCYEANGQQFWDSNNGENYEVVSADSSAMNEAEQHRRATIYNVSYQENWSQFSCWTTLDTSNPYY